MSVYINGESVSTWINGLKYRFKLPDLSPKYVTDGLILHLDGIDYGGQSGKWIDLVNGREFTINGSVSKGDNYFVFNGGSIDSSYQYAITHIEIVLKHTSTSPTSQVVLQPANGNYLVTFNSNTMQFNSGYDVLKNNSRVIPTTINEIFSVSTDYNLSGLIYKNGQVATQSGTKDSWQRSYSGTRIGLFATNNYPFKGEIYSLRIYNRALTAEEIAQNFAVDKARFNIPD